MIIETVTSKVDELRSRNRTWTNWREAHPSHISLGRGRRRRTLRPYRSPRRSPYRRPSPDHTTTTNEFAKEAKSARCRDATFSWNFIPRGADDADAEADETSLDVPDVDARRRVSQRRVFPRYDPRRKQASSSWPFYYQGIGYSSFRRRLEKIPKHCETTDKGATRRPPTTGFERRDVRARGRASGEKRSTRQGVSWSLACTERRRIISCCVGTLAWDTRAQTPRRRRPAEPDTAHGVRERRRRFVRMILMMVLKSMKLLSATRT